MSSGLTEWQRVAQALVLREARTRYGRRHLGYLWALIAPGLHILTLTILFTFGGRRIPAGMEMGLFLVSGIVPWFMFRNTWSQVSNAIRSNRSLLVFPMVKDIDLVVARFILEVGTLVIVYICFVGIFIANGEEFTLGNLAGMVASWLMLAVFGAGFGMLVIGLRTFAESVDSVLSVAVRLMYFTSGVFYTINELPEKVRSVLILQPVATLIDLARGGMFSHYKSSASYTYGLAWTIAMFIIGFSFMIATRRRRAQTL